MGVVVSHGMSPDWKSETLDSHLDWRIAEDECSDTFKKSNQATIIIRETDSVVYGR